MPTMTDRLRRRTYRQAAHIELAARTVAELGRLVDDLVHRREDVVRELHLCDRSAPDGRHADAERVYLEDLEVFPSNGWALLGLRDALRGQNRHDEALRVDEAFQKAWRSADVMPPASCYCGGPVALAK